MTATHPSDTTRDSDLPWRLVALVVGLALMGFIAVQTARFIYDDAYITLRYAVMLAETGELVWNPGERVEGFTNFLYTIWLAGLIWLGIDPELAARASGLAGTLATIAGAVTVARALAPDAKQVAAIAAFVVCGGTIGLVAWGFSGMEAPLVSASVIWTMWALLPLQNGPLPVRRAVLAGCIAALGFLVRMDAVVALAPLIGMALLLGRGPFVDRVRAGAVILAIVVAAIALQLIWRQYYYGEWLPNTFWAKVGVDRAHRLDFGTQYLMGSLVRSPLLLLSILFGLIALAHKATRRWAVVLLVCAAAQLAYVVWSGGDHLPMARFLVPAIPVLAVVMGLALSQSTSLIRWIAVGAMAITGFWAANTSIVVMHGGAEAGLIVGRHIAATVPQDKVIALNVAGAIPFAATEHRFIDMLGLNDKHIARVTDLPLETERQRRPGHAKGDGAYVLARAPDIIIARTADGTKIEDSDYLGGRQLAASAEFERCYALRTEDITVTDNHWMTFTGRGTTLEFIYYERVCN